MFMNLNLLFFLIFLICNSLLPAAGNSKTTSSNTITVIGSVFCDSCHENAFSKRSYFLQSAKVQIKCRFKANTPSRRDRLITANRTTDKYGVYRLDVPHIGDFTCQQGQEKASLCQATIVKSSSSLCNLTGLTISTAHVAIKPKMANMCILNLNALSYKPPKRDASYCGTPSRPLSASSLDSILSFFWPLIPPFLVPWLHWPPLPFILPPLPFPFNSIPLPDPSSLPFSLPPWLLPFLDPSSLPFPFSLFPPPTSPPTPYAPPPFPPN